MADPDTESSKSVLAADPRHRNTAPSVPDQESSRSDLTAVLQHHPVSDVVAQAAVKKKVKWGADRFGVNIISKSLSLGESEFLVFCRQPNDHDILRHLPVLADFMGVPWAIISPDYGKVFAELFLTTKPVLVCSVTGRSSGYHPISEMVALSENKKQVKWGADKSGVDEITRALCMGESELLVLFGHPDDHEMLQHFPALADFKRVPWTSVSPDFGSPYGKPFGNVHFATVYGIPRPLLACAITRAAAPRVDNEDEVEYEEKIGRLNPTLFPLLDESGASSLSAIVTLAFEEGQLECDVHKITEALAMGKSDLVILAADADPYERLLHLPPLAKYKNVPYVFIPSRQQLGYHLERPISACCITTKGGTRVNFAVSHFKKTLRKLINGKSEIRRVEKELDDESEQQSADESNADESTNTLYKAPESWKKELAAHPISDMVADAAMQLRVKWGVDKLEIEEITRILLQTTPAFLVLCGDSGDDDKLRHLPALAEFWGIRWSSISPAYGKAFSRIFGIPQRVLACIITSPALPNHPVLKMVAEATEKNQVKWADDRSGVDEITRKLEELVFLVLFGHPYDHEMLCHFPTLADFKRVPWAYVSPKHGKLLGMLYGTGKPMLACTFTRPAPANNEKEVFGEKTGKLNPKPYPLCDEDRALQLSLIVVQALREGELVYDGVHKVTEALIMGKSAFVIIAADADPYEILLHLPPLAKYMKVPCVFAPSQKRLVEYINPPLPCPVSACCITKKEGISLLNVKLKCFLDAFRGFKHLLHWNGKPEIKAKPKPSARPMPRINDDGVDVDHNNDDVVVLVREVKNFEDVVEFGSLFEEAQVEEVKI